MEQCSALPGCRDAVYLLETFDQAKGLVVVDCIVAAAGFIMTCLAFPQGRLGKRKCFFFLVALAIADAALSLFVRASLLETRKLYGSNALQLMDRLYDSECFVKASYKLIFETQSTLEDYTETIVLLQAGIALFEVLYHVWLVTCKGEAVTKDIFVVVSVFFGAAELIAAGVGVHKYFKVTDQYHTMYAEMDSGSPGVFNSSQACISSCCFPAGISTTDSGGSGCLWNAVTVAIVAAMGVVVLICVCFWVNKPDQPVTNTGPGPSAGRTLSAAERAASC